MSRFPVHLEMLLLIFGFSTLCPCSSDGKFLVSLYSRGPGRVWDVSELKVVASLPKEKVNFNIV